MTTPGFQNHPRQQRIEMMFNSSYNHSSGPLLETLPDLTTVRADAARVSDALLIACSYPDPAPPDVVDVQDFCAQTGLSEDIVLEELVPRSVLLYTMLPRLFKYSFLIDLNDIPGDIVKQVITALELLFRALRECTDLQFATLFRGPWVQGGPTDPECPESVKRGLAREYLIMQISSKLPLLLLSPAIERPREAVQYLGPIVEHMLETAPMRRGQARMEARQVMMLYAEALAQSGEDDGFAESMLENLLEPLEHDSAGLCEYVKMRAYLARVQRRLGKVGKAKKHEKLLVKWFRKNPHVLTDGLLRQLLVPASGPTSPVLEALGGPSWLTERERTEKTDRRLSKSCHKCHAREPFVKLSLCAKCKRALYCSRECQTKDWKSHKPICSKLEAARDEIEQLSLTDPAAAQREKDWNAWGPAADTLPYVSALRLHDDPGRARTHLILEMSVYTPTAGPRIRDKFRVTRVSVVSMSAFLSSFDGATRLEMDKAVSNTRSGGDGNTIVFFIFRMCAGMRTTLLGTGHVATNWMDHKPYNREWRREINADHPPGRLLVLPEGARDAEFDD